MSGSGTGSGAPTILFTRRKLKKKYTFKYTYFIEKKNYPTIENNSKRIVERTEFHYPLREIKMGKSENLSWFVIYFPGRVVPGVPGSISSQPRCS